MNYSLILNQQRSQKKDEVNYLSSFVLTSPYEGTFLITIGRAILSTLTAHSNHRLGHYWHTTNWSVHGGDNSCRSTDVSKEPTVSASSGYNLKMEAVCYWSVHGGDNSCRSTDVSKEPTVSASSGYNLKMEAVCYSEALLPKYQITCSQLSRQ